MKQKNCIDYGWFADLRKWKYCKFRLKTIIRLSHDNNMVFFFNLEKRFAAMTFRPGCGSIFELTLKVIGR